MSKALSVITALLMLLMITGTVSALEVREVVVENGTIVMKFKLSSLEIIKFIFFGSSEIKDFVDNFVSNATAYKIDYFSAYLIPDGDVVTFKDPVLIRLNESIYILSDRIDFRSL